MKCYWITVADATDHIRSKHHGNTPAEVLADFCRVFNDIPESAIRIEETKTLLYDVYGAACFYDDETDTASLTREFLGTYDAATPQEAQSVAYDSLTPDRRLLYKWGNMSFRGVAVRHREKIPKKRKLTDKSLLRAVRREYFNDMSEAEQEAYFG